MLEITSGNDGSIKLRGRLDATQVEAVAAVLDRVTETCVLDFSELDYISSAGLGVLFTAQKRLVGAGKALRLAHLRPHIRELFAIAGFDRIFAIE